MTRKRSYVGMAERSRWDHFPITFLGLSLMVFGVIGILLLVTSGITISGHRNTEFARWAAPEVKEELRWSLAIAVLIGAFCLSMWAYLTADLVMLMRRIRGEALDEAEDWRKESGNYDPADVARWAKQCTREARRYGFYAWALPVTSGSVVVGAIPFFVSLL